MCVFDYFVHFQTENCREIIDALNWFHLTHNFIMYYNRQMVAHMNKITH